MDDGVAVWTDRPQVCNRIHAILRTDARNRAQVVNVDQTDALTTPA